MSKNNSDSPEKIAAYVFYITFAAVVAYAAAVYFFVF